MVFSQTLTEAEQTRLRRALASHPRDHLIFSLALGTGLRLAAIVHLDVGDIFFPDGAPRGRVRLRREIAQRHRTEDAGMPVRDLCRRRGIGPGTYCRGSGGWKRLSANCHSRPTRERHFCYYRRMKYILGFFLLLLEASALPVGVVCAASAAEDSSAAGPVTTVSSVDLARYAGIWYEIAKIPNRFQKQCARSTTAEYSVRGDGQIDVVNRCIKKDGSAEQAAGVAKVVDTGTNARLKVSFVSFLGWRPFWGDYWIIGLDEDYQWAIVGTPDRKYGWILARTRTLNLNTMEAIFVILERNAYKRAAFEMSAQGH
jgi:apolipoprotein D and lipocalin family protein